MGIMIYDPETIAGLERLAVRDGVTKTEALKKALIALCDPEDFDDAGRFPRDLVSYKTWTLGTPPKATGH